MSNIRAHAGEILGTIVSGGGAVGAIGAWQTQLAWGVTVAAGIVAITSGLLTIRSLLRKDK